MGNLSHRIEDKTTTMSDYDSSDDFSLSDDPDQLTTEIVLTDDMSANNDEREDGEEEMEEEDEDDVRKTASTEEDRDRAKELGRSIELHRGTEEKDGAAADPTRVAFR